MERLVVEGVDFTVTDEESRLIDLIVVRALFALEYPITNPLSLKMDLAATNANGTPLDFEKLLRADTFTFFHDVVGIMDNIDRKTGKLFRFLPRCVKEEKVKEDLAGWKQRRAERKEKEQR